MVVLKFDECVWKIFRVRKIACEAAIHVCDSFRDEAADRSCIYFSVILVSSHGVASVGK